MASEFTRPAERTWEHADEVNAVYDEICRNGIESDRPDHVGPATDLAQRQSQRFRAGDPRGRQRMRLTLLFLEPQAKNLGASGSLIFEWRYLSRRDLTSIEFRRLARDISGCSVEETARTAGIRSANSAAKRLDRSGPITASGQVAGYAAKNVLLMETRARVGPWRGESSGFSLLSIPSDRSTSVEIFWYEGASRRV